MAASLVKVPDGQDVWGKSRAQVYDVTGDSSYPSGGYVISPASIGARKITGAVPIGGNAAANALYIVWNQTNGSLQFFSAIGTEVVATTGETGVTVRVAFLSVGTG